MKTILILSFLFLSLHTVSQTTILSDSLLNEVCKTLLAPEYKQLSDTDRVRTAMVKHIDPLIKNKNETEQTEAIDYFFYRMQKTCKEFKRILDGMNTNKGDWVAVEQKPVSTLTKEEYLEFLKIGNFYYRETYGDTVYLKIENDIWEDHFKDGTYSRLKLRWLKAAEFQIEFIESNNLSRKNFSKPGDKYNYQLLEKGDHKYKLSAEIVGADQFVTFYLYFE